MRPIDPNFLAYSIFRGIFAEFRLDSLRNGMRGRDNLVCMIDIFAGCWEKKNDCGGWMGERVRCAIDIGMAQGQRDLIGRRDL